MSSYYSNVFAVALYNKIYRVFIKYCVFPSNFVIFLNSAGSAATLDFYLPCVCTHTNTEGEQRKARVRNILQSSEKTRYLMNTLYHNWGWGRAKRDRWCDGIPWASTGTPHFWWRRARSGWTACSGIRSFRQVTLKQIPNG